MVRYPHTLVISWQEAPVKDEETGIYTPGANLTETVNCSLGSNSEGMKVGGPDGTLIEYSALAIMPLQTFHAPYGAKVVVTMSDGHTFNTTIKAQRNYQAHTEIWL